jgi:hypothetical protein
VMEVMTPFQADCGKKWKKMGKNGRKMEEK